MGRRDPVVARDGGRFAAAGLPHDHAIDLQRLADLAQALVDGLVHVLRRNLDEP
jgi:hypothetical protein